MSIMTEDQNNQLQQNGLEQEIEFEDIEAWTGDRGDNGLTARMKLKRNFDKIKAWIASVDFSLNLKDWFLSKTDDDEAQGEIGFRKGIWIGIKKWFIDLSGNANLNTMRLNGDANISGTVYTNSIKTDDYTGDGMFDSGGMFQYLHGKAKLVCDMIVCRGKFIVNEIEDRIWTYAGGNMIFSAAGSTIFFVEYLDADENPLGYSYINSPWLLKKTPLLGGLIAWSKRKQIQRRLTEYEKSCVRKFRCYEVSDDGTMQTRNWWHENDLAFCQTLNRVKQKTRSTNGYTGSLSNTVYWRKVTGTGSKEIPILDDGKVYDYVDLSLTDCDPVYNDWPAAGDVIVQRGNDTDPDRQGFTTIEVTGDKRGVKVYDDVSGYSMAQKLKTFLGYDANLKRALLEVFGDAYIGAPGEHGDIHNGATYVRYNSKTGKLEIKANISAESVFDENSEEAKTLATVISGLDTGIGEAKDAAAGAKKAADDAQTDATANKTRLNNWASDGYISPTEKTGLKIQWEDMKKEYANICNDAEKYGVNRNAYTTAYNAANSAFSKYTSTAAENITVDDDFSNIAAYYAARQTILDAIAAAAKKYAEDQAKAVSEAHEYLRNALRGKTESHGGLLLTTFINLRQFNGGDNSDPTNYTTWGGLNGVYENGNSPAAWFGGPMVDRRNNDGSYDTEIESKKANSMIRMDGSGYFACGKFFWGNDGSATFKGRVEATEGKIGGFKISEDSIGDMNSSWAAWTFIKDNGLISLKGGEYGRCLDIRGGINCDAYGSNTIRLCSGAATRDANGNVTEYDGKVLLGGEVHVNTNDTGATGNNSYYRTLIGNPYCKTIFDGEVEFKGKVHFTESVAASARTITTSTTLNKDDSIVFCDSLGDITVTLPSSDNYVGRTLKIIRKKTCLGHVTVSGNFNGSPHTYPINNLCEINELIWDGGTWISGYQNVNDY